jgi:hypothetical protein
MWVISTEIPEEYLSSPFFCRATSKRNSRKYGQEFSRFGRSQPVGLLKCSQCGGDVKIHVSPKRNPHSSKLGRTVSLKDHDLCRECWRRILKSSSEVVSYEGRYVSLS